MKVSIVIPCYNEKNTIKKVVEEGRTTPLERREIIVVDDCSQWDASWAEREAFSNG